MFLLNGMSYTLALFTLLAAPRTRRETSEALTPVQVSREAIEGLDHAKWPDEARVVVVIVRTPTATSPGYSRLGQPYRPEKENPIALGVMVAGC